MLGLGRRSVCLTHFDGYEDAPAIAEQLGRFIDRAEQWVEEGARTGEPAAALQERFAAAWRKAIAEEAPRFGEAEAKLLALDVELNAQGLAYAAEARRARG